LRQLFTELAGCADFLIGNEEDFQLALGLTGPASGGKNLLDQTANFKEMILKAKQAYPKVELFATTLREVVNANEHLWGAIMLADDQWIQIEPRLIQVMDRIGGGDGFVGGLLYGLLKGYSLTESLQLAWASGAYVVTLLDDFGLPLNEEQLWRIYEGNARVKR
jgi:2-dehydro-3-deoxygluconokinase